MSCELATEKPMPSMIARLFHGSPTQQPSIRPRRMLETISGGGTVIVLTSESGLMPWLASQ